MEWAQLLKVSPHSRPQVKNILFHCVKEAVNSLKRGSSEEEDGEEKSWHPFGLIHNHQHTSPPKPISSHGGLWPMTMKGGLVRVVMWPRGRHSVNHARTTCRWPVRGTPTSTITPNLQCQERPLDWQGLNLIHHTSVRLKELEHREDRGILETECSMLVGSPLKATMLERNSTTSLHETKLNSLVWLMVHHIKM